MSGHYIRKRTRLGTYGWALASFAAMLLLAALAFLRLQILDLQGFSVSIAAIAALVLLALLMALSGIAKAWTRGDRGGGRAVAALFLSSLVAVPFALGIALALEYPTSSMAQTDGIDPASAAEVQVASAEPGSTSIVLGRDFRATAADVYSAARATLEASGWDVVEVQASRVPQPAEGDLGVSGTVIVPIPRFRDALGDDKAQGIDPFAASDSDEYLITAVAYAPILGFASDVTVRIAEVEGTSYVDMRSVSRDLPRDLGQNRRFIEGFLARLDAAVTLLQSGPEAAES